MLKIIGILLVSLVVAIAVFHEPLREQAESLITADMFVSVDTDTWDPGPDIGALMPPLDATYQGQVIQSLDAFSGDRGTVFIVVRSADWCPYCRSQLAELQEHRQAFSAAGIGLIALTYDPPEKQQPLISSAGIEYPVLSDNNAASAKALGILNTDYQPGDMAYGVAHPGVLVLNKNQRIVGKLFIESYATRVDAQGVLAYAKHVLNTPVPAG